MADTILVVDDEANIRESLRGVLVDEGYEVLEAENGRAALAALDRTVPRLAIVDIWMPEMDGIELVQRMRQQVPRVPIVVISGHGTIETAVHAIRLGATDFLEKPFQLDALLQTVNRALGDDGGRAGAPVSGPPLAPPRRVPQRTIARSVVVNGQGLHSGVRTGLILQPLPPGSGIVFGITNLLVKMQGEVPILDGSALELCALLEEGGIAEQADTVEELVIDRRYAVGGEGPGGESIAIEPADAFEVDYTLDYPPPIGRQALAFRLTDAAAFRREIA